MVVEAGGLEGVVGERLGWDIVWKVGGSVQSIVCELFGGWTLCVWEIAFSEVGMEECRRGSAL